MYHPPVIHMTFNLPRFSPSGKQFFTKMQFDLLQGLVTNIQDSLKNSSSKLLYWEEKSLTIYLNNIKRQMLS